MKKEMVLMPIGVLNLKSISLDNILKGESMLIDLCKRYDLEVDMDSFVSEWKNCYGLKRFTDIKEYIEYIISKYLPSMVIEKVTYIPNNSNDSYKFVGTYNINIEVFNYLNEKLWPDILNVHTAVIARTSDKDCFRVKTCFSFEDIKKLYPDFTYARLINEFLSDLSLYLTYNKLGMLVVDEEPIVSSKELELPMDMFIY